MKKLKYLFAILFAVVATACTDPNIGPHDTEGDDDDEPVIIGQPPRPNP